VAAIVTPGRCALLPAGPQSRSFLTEEIGRGLLNINQQRRSAATSRQRRAVAAADVGDDLTLERHRRGLKSEILATRRAACETPIGVNHRFAFSYVLQQ